MISEIRQNGADAQPSQSAMHKTTDRSENDLSPATMAWLDLLQSVKLYWFWMALGWNDILQRYRGSMLGPFWLTLTTGIFIAGLGPLYAKLFGTNPRDYLPTMTMGIVSWSFITSSINESSKVFINSATLMKQMKLPRSMHLFHVLWRSTIVLVHNIPIVVVVMIYAGISPGFYTLAIIPGFLLLCINLLWIGFAVAIIATRYRDVVQIIQSVLTLAFFLTPVLWHPSTRRVPSWVVHLNPFAAFIEMLRAPLLNAPIDTPHIVMALSTAVIGLFLSWRLFVRYRKYIIYWV